MASSMAKQIIKRLNECHLAEIMAVENACHEFAWSEKLMASCLSGRYSAYGMFKGESLIAFYLLEQAGPDLTLMDICVHPSEQGKGLAKVLMMHMKSVINEYKGENIFLEVRASNTSAIALYLASGFVKNGLRKSYYPAGEGREDALLMQYSVAR